MGQPLDFVSHSPANALAERASPTEYSKPLDHLAVGLARGEAQR